MMIELTFLVISIFVIIVLNAIIIRLTVTYSQYKEIITKNPDIASLLVVLIIFQICCLFVTLLELNKYWRYDYY